MVREVSFNANDMIGKPVAGAPVRFGIKRVGHIVRIDGNKVICAIDDDGKIMSLLRSGNLATVEVVKK